MASMLVVPPEEVVTIPVPPAPSKPRPKLQRQNAVTEPPKKKQKLMEAEWKKIITPYFTQNGIPVYKIA